MVVRSLLLVTCVAACWRTAEPVIAPVFDGVVLEHSRCAQSSVLVPVEIDGTVGTFIVDTGAFTNVVYESFAKRAKLTLQDNAERIGGGRGVHVLKVIPHSFSIPGVPDVAMPDLMMLDEASSPLAKDGCGIAGVISPALMVTHGSALLIDFAARRLARISVAEIDNYLARIGTKQFVAGIHENEYTPGIDVTFGERSLRMMIDTGACCTWVTTSSKVGRYHLPKSERGGTMIRLMGTTQSRVVRSQLAFGDVSRRLDIRLLDPDVGDSAEDGALGADALRGCVVAISPTEMRGACR